MISKFTSSIVIQEIWRWSDNVHPVVSPKGHLRQAPYFPQLEGGVRSAHTMLRFSSNVAACRNTRSADSFANSTERSMVDRRCLSHVQLDLTSKRMLEIMHAFNEMVGISVSPSIWSAHNVIRVEARCSQLESSTVIRAWRIELFMWPSRSKNSENYRSGPRVQPKELQKRADAAIDNYPSRSLASTERHGSISRMG